MDIPQTRYAKSGTVSIAYQVSGEDASIDLVWAPGTVSDLDKDLESPDDIWWVERFHAFCRLIRFDKRGTGLSDRPTNVASLEERTDDIRAVMDAAGSERAVILGLWKAAAWRACSRPPIPIAHALGRLGRAGMGSGA